MTSLPTWLRLLRLYCRTSPIARGKFRLALYAYRPDMFPAEEVEGLLDWKIPLQLRLRVWVDFNIYCIGLYEQYLAHFFKRQLTRNTVFFDVGAYIGQYALLASYYAPEGQVYAFEPIEESASRLHQAASRSSLRNIHISKTAVGESVSQAIFYLSPDVFMSSTVEAHTSYTRTIVTPVTTLDAFCEEHRIDRVDLLKIDVEEAEDAVIRGAYNTLQRFQPTAIIEIGKGVRPGAPSHALQIMESLGYRFFTVDHGALRPLHGDLADSENVVALPNTKL